MPRLLPSPWEQTIAAVAMQTSTEDPGNQRSGRLHKERMVKDKEAEEAAANKRLEEEKQKAEAKKKRKGK